MFYRNSSTEMISEGFTKATEKINNNDVSGLQELLKSHEVEIDEEDDHGMTLLQHAAFKGKKELCQLLLDLGADPNGGHHEHQYSALHFAALSGNLDICQQLLHCGSKPDALNSVGRTATQMAAFVGNHGVVSVINNFIPRTDIEQYTVVCKDETEPKLPPAAAPALHKFVMQVNLHPVHLLLTVQKLPLLSDNLSKVGHVLELLSENQMKRSHEANEILSLKYHYLRFLVERLAKEQQQHSDKPVVELINQYVKAFLKPRTSDGFPEFMDNFIRESVRTFPFKETTVFRQLLVNLSKTKQSLDSQLALSLLSSCINGQRGFQDDDACATCGQEKVPSKCSICKSVQYCNRDCQKIHWFIHKKECDKLAKQFKNLEIKSQNSQANVEANQ
uniref:EOG090X06BA n=1 Tax=Simocephalus serrulatus TaxID=117539 RepID=A0A4Y7NLX3_9CRUS|nr:EOG090X06BA [Simocephalus serrulatus]SVE94240.1 EOG090X06BA [Simocephalus serrulatus]